MKRSILLFVIFAISAFSSHLHAEEYCVGIARSCSSYSSFNQIDCDFQRGCRWSSLLEQCQGIAHSCGALQSSACHFQDGCHVFVRFDNLSIFNHVADQIIPDQLNSSPSTTPHLFHINVDETSRSWLSWSSVNKEIRIEYAYNSTNSWNHYETLQPGASSAVLCHSGVRLNITDYCTKMPSIYEGKLFFRFKIGNAPNWVYIRPISFYYNS